MDQRVEHVGDRDDARTDGNLGFAQAVRITAAVPSLVVAFRDLRGELECRLPGRPQQPCSGERVRLHQHPLVLAERPLLVENPSGNRELADVVQRNGLAEVLEEAAVEPQTTADPDADFPYPPGVPDPRSVHAQVLQIDPRAQDSSAGGRPAGHATIRASAGSV